MIKTNKKPQMYALRFAPHILACPVRRKPLKKRGLIVIMTTQYVVQYLPQGNAH